MTYERGGLPTRPPVYPQYAATQTSGPAVDVVNVGPRIASFGPVLNFGSLDSPLWIPDEPIRRFTFSWLVRLLSAFIVSAVVLLAPMGALAYAADQLAGPVTSLGTQQVPGGLPPAELPQIASATGAYES